MSDGACSVPILIRRDDTRNRRARTTPLRALVRRAEGRASARSRVDATLPLFHRRPTGGPDRRGRSLALRSGSGL